jgi:2-isopropylmalate synthase
MALKVRNDILPYRTGIDTTKIMNISAGRHRVGLSGAVQQGHRRQERLRARKRHPPGRDAEERRDLRDHAPRPDIGLKETNLVMGKHSGRAALRAKLRELGFDLADNQLNDVFVRFKALADRKKEVFDDDLIALMRDQARTRSRPHPGQVPARGLRHRGPQSADLILSVDGVDHRVTRTGDGPVDATFNAVKMLFPHRRGCSSTRSTPSPKAPTRRRP